MVVITREGRGVSRSDREGGRGGEEMMKKRIRQRGRKGKMSVTARTEAERKRRLEKGTRKSKGNNNENNGGKEEKRDRRKDKKRKRG